MSEPTSPTAPTDKASSSVPSTTGSTSSKGQQEKEAFDEKQLKQVAESMWTYRGQKLPAFADIPKEGEESVWLYPRPPSILPEKQRIQVFLNDEVIADTTRGVKICETAHPPTFYIPMDDVKMNQLSEVPGRSSYCEWKGTAKYYKLKNGGRGVIGWSYPKPHSSKYKDITNTMCFYIDREGVTAQVGKIKARAQGGGFYGGWVLKGLHAGPFKGDPGAPHL